MEFYSKKLTAKFDINDFLEMRRREDAYMIFYKHFIKCITKKTVYEENIQKATTYNDICTVSDEAFALLLLENSWDRWMDIYKHDQTALLPRRGGQQRQLFSCHIPTKYTKGGYKYGNTEESGSNKKGWSREGIQRYNELFALVDADRKEHPDFLWLFLNDVRQENKKATDRRSGALKPPPVIAHHNLFKTISPSAPSLSSNSPRIESILPPQRENPFGETTNYEDDVDDNGRDQVLSSSVLEEV